MAAIGGVGYLTSGTGVPAYLLSRLAMSATSMALDPSLRRQWAVGDWPGALAASQAHFPFWGPMHSSLKAVGQGAYVQAGLQAGALALDVAGLRYAGRRPAGARGVNPYIGKPKPELLKSKSSYEKLIKEHQAKLDAFKKDPIGNTNPANLKQMMKDNPTQEVLLERAKGRIGALEKQLTKQQGELKQINEALKKLE